MSFKTKLDLSQQSVIPTGQTADWKGSVKIGENFNIGNIGINPRNPFVGSTLLFDSFTQSYISGNIKGDDSSGIITSYVNGNLLIGFSGSTTLGPRLQSIKDLSTYGIMVNYGNDVSTVSLSGSSDLVLYNPSGISGSTISLGLSDTGVSGGTYGSSTVIPVLTIDNKGRITNVTGNTVNIVSALSGLTDVSLNTPVTNNILAYSGSTWYNTTISNVLGYTPVSVSDLGNYIPLSGTVSSNKITGNLIVEDNTTIKFGRDLTINGGSEGSWFEVKHGGGSGNIGIYSKGNSLGFTAGITVNYTGVVTLDSYNTTITASNQLKLYGGTSDLWLSTDRDVLMFGKNLKLPTRATADRAFGDGAIAYNTQTIQYEGRRDGFWKNFLMEGDAINGNGLTNNYLPKWNGTTLVDSRLNETTYGVEYKPVTGGGNASVFRVWRPGLASYLFDIAGDASQNTMSTNSFQLSGPSYVNSNVTLAGGGISLRPNGAAYSSQLGIATPTTNGNYTYPIMVSRTDLGFRLWTLGYGGDFNHTIAGTGTIHDWAYGGGSATIIARMSSNGLVVGGNTIDSSLIADFQSTTKGIGIPRMTSGLTGTPARSGSIGYDAVANEFKFGDNSAWRSFAQNFTVANNAWVDLNQSVESGLLNRIDKPFRTVQSCVDAIVALGNVMQSWVVHVYGDYTYTGTEYIYQATASKNNVSVIFYGQITTSISNATSTRSYIYSNALDLSNWTWVFKNVVQTTNVGLINWNQPYCNFIIEKGILKNGTGVNDYGVYVTGVNSQVFLNNVTWDLNVPASSRIYGILTTTRTGCILKVENLFITGKPLTATTNYGYVFNWGSSENVFINNVYFADGSNTTDKEMDFSAMGGNGFTLVNNSNGRSIVINSVNQPKVPTGKLPTNAYYYNLFSLSGCKSVVIGNAQMLSKFGGGDIVNCDLVEIGTVTVSAREFSSMNNSNLVIRGFLKRLEPSSFYGNSSYPLLALYNSCSITGGEVIDNSALANVVTTYGTVRSKISNTILNKICILAGNNAFLPFIYNYGAGVKLLENVTMTGTAGNTSTSQSWSAGDINMEGNVTVKYNSGQPFTRVRENLVSNL